MRQDFIIIRRNERVDTRLSSSVKRVTSKSNYNIFIALPAPLLMPLDGWMDGRPTLQTECLKSSDYRKCAKSNSSLFQTKHPCGTNRLGLDEPISRTTPPSIVTVYTTDLVRMIHSTANTRINKICIFITKSISSLSLGGYTCLGNVELSTLIIIHATHIPRPLFTTLSF